MSKPRTQGGSIKRGQRCPVCRIPGRQAIKGGPCKWCAAIQTPPPAPAPVTVKPELITTLPDLDEMELIIMSATERTATPMKGGRLMETFRVGDKMLCRYTFPLCPENNPYTQTAQELIQYELEK